MAVRSLRSAQLRDRTIVSREAERSWSRFIESQWKGRRRPYHKQKLALVLANMRHFAIEQGRRGFAIHYIQTREPYDQALRRLSHLGSISVMEPAERELRKQLASNASEGNLTVLPHEGWLSSTKDFLSSQGTKETWRMDRFYKLMRKKTGLLMEGDKPTGGKYSFDADNRQPWKGTPTPPEPPSFKPDEVTREVCDLVGKMFANHPGELDPAALPTTRADAVALWQWAKQSCMPQFGPYEDAMTTQSSGLFHTRTSALVNLHRLTPKTVVDDVAALEIPLASKEGFIRQVLGWREFVRHVHQQTDGFRLLSSKTRVPRAREPGDGGFSRWSTQAQPRQDKSKLDGGAKPNELGANNKIPLAFWGETSGLACLDRVVSDVWKEAYSHHITRLMILCNLAALLDVTPRDVADWFWIAYSDAYDWVVEPNVLGMGLFATGDLMTTKPYVSGTPYINKMSDYCKSCEFNPKKDCPVSSLYWAYLGRHESTLSKTHRLRIPIASLKRRDDANRKRDESIFDWVSKTLANGEVLRPENVPP